MATQTFAALFATRNRAAEAVDSLKDAGIPGRKISVLSHDDLEDGETGGLSAGEGAAAGATGAAIGGIIASLGLAAVPGVGWIMAAGPIGSMLATGATAAAAGAVAGGIAGALTDNGIDKEDAEIYAEAVRRGGTLVVVEADTDNASTASTLMRSHHPMNIERLRADWKSEGWVRYDPKAKPLRGDELRRSRERFNERTLKHTQPPSAGVDPYLRSYHAV